MHIRFAQPEDLDACLALDTSFETGRAWQVDLREQRDQIAVQLRASALPRQLRVDYPSPEEALLMHWQRGYCLLVARDPVGGQVVGYTDVGPEPDLQTGWIWYLGVDQRYRRQGVGSRLLAAATQWCREHQLRRLMVPLQIQNDPGIQFCHRHGFSFCGFNNRYFKAGGVALFFGRNLR